MWLLHTSCCEWILKFVCLFSILKYQTECWQSPVCFLYSCDECPSLCAFFQPCWFGLTSCRHSYSHHLQRLTLPAHGSAYRELPTGTCYLFEVSGALGVPVHQSWGNLKWSIPSSSRACFLIQFVKQLIGSVFLLWVPSPGCCAPSFTSPLRYADYLSILDGVIRS